MAVDTNNKLYRRHLLFYLKYDTADIRGSVEWQTLRNLYYKFKKEGWLIDITSPMHKSNLPFDNDDFVISNAGVEDYSYHLNYLFTNYDFYNFYKLYDRINLYDLIITNNVQMTRFLWRQFTPMAVVCSYNHWNKYCQREDYYRFANLSDVVIMASKSQCKDMLEWGKNNLSIIKLKELGNKLVVGKPSLNI